MPSRPHLAVKLARQATPDDLAARLRDIYGVQGGKGKRVEVELKAGERAQLGVTNTKGLTVAEKSWIWELFESNMKALYESSAGGYDPAEKRTELFHAESRFLLLYPSPSAASTAEKAANPLGYCIFRFDTEETDSEDDNELCDVAYSYELQVDAAAQGRGAGKALMDALERLAKAYKMDKTMLTVFKHNKQAVGFYEKTGYDKDEIDPSVYGVDDVDYMILSKDCS
ncbi:hypothetical protein JCM10213_008087 [Rhodosporidiobolus nylandii]